MLLLFCEKLNTMQIETLLADFERELVLQGYKL